MGTQEETEARSVGRGDSDTEARDKAWQATQRDVEAHPDQVWDMIVQTDAYSPGRIRLASDSGAGPA